MKSVFKAGVMRFFSALFFIVTASFVLPGIADHASNSQEFNIDGTQENLKILLKDVDSHIRYEDQEVPDTCYRTEPDGFETQCETINHQDCTPFIRRECHDEPRSECQPITRRECRDVPHRDCQPITRRECHDVPHRECHPTTRRECHTIPDQQCHTTTHHECSTQVVCRSVPDQVCRINPDGTSVCTPISRTVCNNESVCRDVPRQECVDRSRTECRDVPDQVCRETTTRECHDVSDQVCREFTTQECRDVPDQVCRHFTENVCRDVHDQFCVDRPEEVCRQVPKFKQVPYECTKIIRVPVGTEIDFEVEAKVEIQITGLNSVGDTALGIRPQELMIVGIENNNSVIIKISKSSGQYLIFEKHQIKVTNPTEKKREIEAVFQIDLKSIRQISAPFEGSLSDFKINLTTTSFRLGNVQLPELLDVNLKIQRPRFLASRKLVFEGDIPEGGLQFIGDGNSSIVVIDLGHLNLLETLKEGRNYFVSPTVRLKKSVSVGLLNPEILPEDLKVTGSEKITLE